MSTSGKMSVGIRTIASSPSRVMPIAMTTKVYGRRSASRTIHMVLLALRVRGEDALEDVHGLADGGGLFRRKGRERLGDVVARQFGGLGERRPPSRRKR